MAEFWEENLILRVVCGSRAHGLATPESDLDTRGVCIPPKRFLLGLSRFEQHENESGDHTTFSLHKFVRLALDGNPNIIETLYTEEEDVLFRNRFGDRLWAARDLFLSRKLGERFMGYALSQLKRIEGHYRWLKDPPAKPRPEDHGAILEAGVHRFSNTHAERAYRAALKHYHQYTSWRTHRNPKRARLEDLYGYDTKHASHLCRLLNMGEEILRDGVVQVRRPDADWLLSIRRGAMAYEELLAWAESRLAALPALLEASPLPEVPPRDEAEGLVVEICEEFLLQHK